MTRDELRKAAYEAAAGTIKEIAETDAWSSCITEAGRLRAEVDALKAQLAEANELYKLKADVSDALLDSCNQIESLRAQLAVAESVLADAECERDMSDAAYDRQRDALAAVTRERDEAIAYAARELAQRRDEAIADAASERAERKALLRTLYRKEASIRDAIKERDEARAEVTRWKEVAELHENCRRITKENEGLAWNMARRFEGKYVEVQRVIAEEIASAIADAEERGRVAERDACLAIVDKGFWQNWVVEDITDAIRSRGKP